MKPIIILPPKAMDEQSIAMLRENGICVVVAENPSAVKFVDAIPAVTSRSQMENAAIQLSRKLLTGQGINSDNRKVFAEMYVELLDKGTALDSKPTQEEQEKQAYDYSKIEEQRKIAREDARAEKASKKIMPSKPVGEAKL